MLTIHRPSRTARISWNRSSPFIKEIAVSNINTPSEQSTKTQQVELLDCGPASQATKGFPFFPLSELAIPPIDRRLWF